MTSCAKQINTGLPSQQLARSPINTSPAAGVVAGACCLVLCWSRLFDCSGLARCPGGKAALQRLRAGASRQLLIASCGAQLTCSPGCSGALSTCSALTIKPEGPPARVHLR